jgi:hypothetical protein
MTMSMGLEDGVGASLAGGACELVGGGVLAEAPDEL